MVESTEMSSSARFLLIAPQSGDLIPELLGTLLISAGQSHSEGKFQLFKLMLALRMGVGRIGSRLAAGRWSSPPAGGGA